MEQKIKENLGWINLLRIIACFLVLLSHSCDPFVAQADTDHNTFLSGVFIGSLVRPCVPLFAMMTGVLLLPIHIGMKDFYKKRIGRIIVPLIFWSIVLPILFFVYLNYINPSTTNPGIPKDEHSVKATLNRFYTFVFNFNFDTIPLWYLYMLIGLYLVIPIVSVWIKQASKQDIKLFLRIWGISLLLPYLKMFGPLLGYAGNYGNKGLFGVCDWNEFGTFYYVSGFIGYLVLAYYLVQYPPTWSWKKMLGITVPMFCAGYAITFFGFVMVHKFFPGNSANLEVVWYFSGINVFMMTFPVFVIVQKLHIASSERLSRVASLTFGIYLSHFVFVQVAYDLFGTIQSLPVVVRIILIACFSFSVGYIIARLMKHFRLTRRFVA